MVIWRGRQLSIPIARYSKSCNARSSEIPQFCVILQYIRHILFYQMVEMNCFLYFPNDFQASLDSQKIYFKVNLIEYLKSFVAMRESVCVRANTKNINRMRKKTRGSQLMRRPIITCDSHTHKQEMTSAYWYGDLIHARTQSSFHLCSVSLPLPR